MVSLVRSVAGRPAFVAARFGCIAFMGLALIGCAGSGDAITESASAAEEPATTTAEPTTTSTTSTTVAPTTTAPSPTTTAPPTTAPPPPPTTTRPPAPVASPPTTPPPPPPPPPAFTGDPDTFRLPMNGRVNVTLAWDCGGCVVELGSKHHPAIDYKSRDDDTVVAAGHGTVVVVNDGCASPSQGCGQSMGNSIFLRHALVGGGEIFTFYAHLAEIDPAVQPGACVRQGQRLGLMGNSGIASAAHLHFSFQTHTDILQYTVESSYEHGSRDPTEFYGRVKVQPCG